MATEPELETTALCDRGQHEKCPGKTLRTPCGCSCHKAVLFLPITETRPEEIRVMKVGRIFVVEVNSTRSGWMTISERLREDDAKQEALDWYR